MHTDRDITDFSHFTHYDPDTNVYTLQLRWKPLTAGELYSIASYLSTTSKQITHLDLNQTKIGSF